MEGNMDVPQIQSLMAKELKEEEKIAKIKKILA